MAGVELSEELSELDSEEWIEVGSEVGLEEVAVGESFIP